MQNKAHRDMRVILASLFLFPAISFALRGDYTGDKRSDLTVAVVSRILNKTTWSIKDIATGEVRDVQLSAPGDALVPADYDGDGVTDPAIVFVASDGSLEWHTWLGGTEVITKFGVNGDQPVAGDFDCDGTADKAVVRSNSSRRLVWNFELSSGIVVNPVQFGQEDDVLYAAHMSANSCDDMVLARVSDALITWYSKSLNGKQARQVVFGKTGDVPYAPADVDGDGQDEFIVLRNSVSTRQAVVRNADASESSVTLGAFSETPLSGNFSGPGPIEFGIYRQAVGKATSRFVLTLPSGISNLSFGKSASILIRPDGTVVQPNDMSVGRCGLTLSIDKVSWVLYKPSNLHGGRGPTFLVQDPAERTGKRRLQIKDINCKTISYFGLYATDRPYGARYYQASGGSRHTAQQLYRLATKAGSSTILVEGKGKWVAVNDPRLRQGRVHN